MATTYKVLIADPLSPAGVEILQRNERIEVTVHPGGKGMKEEELLPVIGQYDALIVRSQTQVSEKILAAATNLKAVGRAGVGVDNIDQEAATRRGVIVMNTPDGNTISTAEHAFSLMVSLARKIPQAHASVSGRKWDRKSFTGVEIYGKTLAVLGMGRIGTEFARRAIAFGMRVIAYDPYLSVSRARSLQVELVENLDDVVAQADFVTMHMPLTKETRHMLDARRLGLAKKGVRIINCARGGLVDEAALAEALKSGQVAGAALDVFEQEPPDDAFALWDAPNTVFTPHLGASTTEAQENVGIEIAENISSVLLDGTIKNATNVPNIDSKTLAIIRPYLDFGRTLGRFLSQIAAPRCEKVTINYSGKVNSVDTKPITRAIMHGYLEMMGDDRVNSLNVMSYVGQLGISVTETSEMTEGEYTDLIEVSAGSGEDSVKLEGTFFGHVPRVVAINGRHVEAWPQGYILLLENLDRPGIVGTVGTMLGTHKVNIARMSLSRNEIGGQALTVLNVDSKPPEALVQELLEVPDITHVKIVSL